MPEVTSEIKAKIFWLAGSLDTKEKIILKLATQETPAKIKILRKIDSSTLKEIRDKNKISEKMKGRKLSDQHKLALSEAKRKRVA